VCCAEKEDAVIETSALVSNSDSKGQKQEQQQYFDQHSKKKDNKYDNIDSDTKTAMVMKRTMMWIANCF